MISFAWRLLDIFEKCTENENFKIFKSKVFTIFFPSKAWNLPKTLKILFFVLYDITYIQNTGNGNTYLNLPLNLNIMRYFFWRVYVISYFFSAEQNISQRIIIKDERIELIWWDDKTSAFISLWHDDVTKDLI